MHLKLEVTTYLRRTFCCFLNLSRIRYPLINPLPQEFYLVSHNTVFNETAYSSFSHTSIGDMNSRIGSFIIEISLPSTVNKSEGGPKSEFIQDTPCKSQRAAIIHIRQLTILCLDHASKVPDVSQLWYLLSSKDSQTVQRGVESLSIEANIRMCNFCVLV